MATNLPTSQHRSKDQEMDNTQANPDSEIQLQSVNVRLESLLTQIQGSEPSENGNEIHSRGAQDTQAYHKPPPGRIENILKEGGIRQASAAGPSGTPRSQKIGQLYDVFSKIRKKKKLYNKPIEETRELNGNRTAPKSTDDHPAEGLNQNHSIQEVDKTYADQLRDLAPGYTGDFSVDKAWAFGSLCTIMNFSVNELNNEIEPRKIPPYLVEELLHGDQTFSNQDPNSVRWIHLPVNNMAWLEV